MRVVGLSTAHDGSVAIYTDGEIEFFMKEERITKRKRDKNPFAAMAAAARFLGDKKVDAIAMSAPHDTYLDPYLHALTDAAIKMFKTENVYKMFSYHHLCHASLAFYNSGFDKALCVIMDRNGSNYPDTRISMFESETVFVGEYPSKFTEIRKHWWCANKGQMFDPIAHELVSEFKRKKPYCDVRFNSTYGITKVYETATVLIGESILENGKTMGLAAYGDKNKEFPNLFLADGSPNDGLFAHVPQSNLGNSSVGIFNGHQDKITKSLKPDNYQFYADYAFQVQRQTQEQGLKIIKDAVEKTGIKNVCVSGGYGLNVVANGYYISQLPDVTFYFEPLADDTGNSLGAAMLVYRELTRDTAIRPIHSTFFNGHEPEINLSNLDDSLLCTADAAASRVAELLVNHAKVAIFNGKAEAGPRALGNRSILFYPTLKDSKDIVNRIKKREWYRPFAACVLEEDAGAYFDMLGIEKSPHMTISFDCRETTKTLFPGIVHVDNSCRVQTVGPENPHLYQLLSEVKKLTGHGLLMNTSFNLAGSPL
ncbi:MAG: carbamoyltransferase C-terminal domain-containing protein, partial [Burkholderiales bacterium]